LFLPFLKEKCLVSRAHKGLVSALFKREVPEVNNGAVVVKEIAREPGNRTKIAVASTQSGVDPVGSCVGQKGVRVQAVINELGGLEKIDIIQWHDDPKIFIPAALSPAKDIETIINEKKRTAIAYIPDDQLSLAIGKDGQNVRLSAKLTGYKIDIKSKSEEGKKADELKSDKTAVAADIEKKAKKTVKKKISEKKDAKEKKEIKKTEPKKSNNTKSL